MGLAATLAELSIEDFDRSVRMVEGVYRYFRFSDDILIFSFVEPAVLNHQLETLVSERGMSFNMRKCYDVSACYEGKKGGASASEFEYLGYKFCFSDHCEDRAPRKVTVSIADAKITRIKTRIVRAFRAFLSDHDALLLYDRIRYLSSNYIVGKHRSGASRIFEVRSGIYYNYRLCGVYSDGEPSAHPATEIKQVDGFYRSLLSSKFSEFKAPLNAHATVDQINRLKKLSFYVGFRSKMVVHFSSDRKSKIREAWKYAR